MSKMSTNLHVLKQEDGNLVNPPQNSTPQSSSSSSLTNISPVILLVIVILALIFFIYGLVHFLLRFLMKRPSSSSIFQSNRFPETSGSSAIHRQLQQLFRLHDSGLSHAAIDSLPVFCCKDLVGGSKEPFDCAVCLCEFGDHDKLRLLPMCGHAFHIECIDTWLLSNSTCPLCRGSLLGPGVFVENPMFNFDDSSEMSSRFVCDEENVQSSGPKAVSMEEDAGEKRVFSVRLGKFRSLNEVVGETSSCNLDARRCYSMGTYQYVVGDSNLQVALSRDCGGGSDANKLVKEEVHNGNLQGKEIWHKGESFSVSKIWLWSRKNKFPGSSNAHNGLPPFSIMSPVNSET